MCILFVVFKVNFMRTVLLVFTLWIWVVQLQAQAPVRATSIALREPDGDPFLESELIQSVSYVDLKISKFGAITSDMELREVDNNYFLLDNKFTNSVYRFDSSGNLLGTIGEVKTTAATSSTRTVLTNPAMFNVDPFQKQVEIYNFENSTIARYTYVGKKVDQISLNLSPADFTRDKTGAYWIYTGWNSTDTQYRLVKADKSGRIVDRKLRLVSKIMPTLALSFSQNIYAIYFCELLGNSTYKIEGTEPVETFRFDFGPYNLPTNFHMIDPLEAFNGINSRGYFTVRKYLENEQFAYFFLNFTGPNKREMLHVIYEKKTARTFRYKEDSGIALFDKAYSLNENNELLFLITPRKMRQLMVEGGGFIPESFEEIAENVKNYRNPVILKVKLQGSGH
jgi:hypothetical protein